MKKKKATKTNFVDEIKRFSSHGQLKIGDIVVYRRYSDKKFSIGEIKWFANTSEGMSATFIDQNLGNFQLGLVADIEENPNKSRITKLTQKKKLIEKKDKKSK